ncbi:MAG: hypothetical protein PHT94_01735 [Candidatus Nanoarchaeia archaeon]|nr:hypothetical protein [Candidatus Nanoarchaeia archaeon]
MNEPAPKQNIPGIAIKTNKQPTPQQKKVEDIDIIKNQLKEMTDNYISFIRRVRILEEKFNNLQKKISLMDKVSLDNQKSNKEEVSKINSSIYSIQRGVTKLNDNVHIIISDLKETAKLQDLEELEKYIDMWQPCNFVTNNDVESIIKRIVEKSFDDVHIKLQEEENLRKMTEEILVNKKYIIKDLIKEVMFEQQNNSKINEKREENFNKNNEKKQEEKPQENNNKKSDLKEKRKEIWQ